MMAQREPFILKFAARDRIPADEQEILANAISEVREVEPDQDIVREGSRPTSSTMLLDGFTARYRDLANGKRQITAIHVAGDFVDLHSFLIRKMDHSVTTLSPCRLAMVPHRRLREITEQNPHLTRILWLSTLIDAAIHREWLVSMGRRPAVARIAHLLCELYLRLLQVEKAEKQTFVFPVTQAELSDILGLSIVHVNRSLQDLRSTGVILWRGERITIADWDRLRAIAEFDDTYLNLRQEPR